jgi:hypothetical protein
MDFAVALMSCLSKSVSLADEILKELWKQMETRKKLEKECKLIKGKEAFIIISTTEQHKPPHHR